MGILQKRERKLTPEGLLLVSGVFGKTAGVRLLGFILVLYFVATGSAFAIYPGAGSDVAAVLRPQSTQSAAPDGSGNVAGLVDADTGMRSATYEYDPFGQTIRATGPAADLNPFRFSTRYADDESGLLYYGYRYYNPSTGRWLNRDPIGEAGGLNLYGFVGNDPANYVDVLGLSIDGEDDDFPIGNTPLDGYRWDEETRRRYDQIDCESWENAKEWLKDTAKEAGKEIVIGTVTGGLGHAAKLIKPAARGMKAIARLGKKAADKIGSWWKGRKSAGALPKTRDALHIDLRNKGFDYKSTSGNGYVTYKGPDGRTVTIKPSGEVIPTQRLLKADGSGKFPQRQDYSGNPLPNQSHSTDHFVEPLADILP